MNPIIQQYFKEMEGEAMSAPTLFTEEPYPGTVGWSRLVNATPADVRLWLLDQGAEQRQWCEAHEAEQSVVVGGLRKCWKWEAYAEGDKWRKECRMVSVLVWRGEVT